MAFYLVKGENQSVSKSKKIYNREGSSGADFHSENFNCEQGKLYIVYWAAIASSVNNPTTSGMDIIYSGANKPSNGFSYVAVFRATSRNVTMNFNMSMTYTSVKLNELL